MLNFFLNYAGISVIILMCAYYVMFLLTRIWPMLLFTTYYYWKFSQFIVKNIIFMYRLKLAPAFNIILFLLCIIISQITNLYYVINKIIGRSVFYFFEYLQTGPTFEWIHMSDVPESVLFEGYPTKIKDRYYIFYYFFFALHFIRLWIFKESYLFLIFHLLFMYCFLFDLHLFYTYCYLLTVTIE